MDDDISMKKIFLVTAVSAAALLGACGSTSSASKTHPAPTKVVTTKKIQRPTATPVGFNKSRTVLILPHVGKATKTITTFAKQDKAFYREIINPADWVKSPTFGQYIFVGPYTSGRQYRQIRDAKLSAVDLVETDVLFSQGATTWPSKIGAINATAFNQVSAANMPSTVAVEQSDAKQYQSNAYKLNVPSFATVIESPVGILTPQMVQEHRSRAGVCIPHPIAVYFKGTTNPAMTGGATYMATPSYHFQYGPTDNIGGNLSTGVSAASPTSTCITMP
jgi:hypothetical protein